MQNNKKNKRYALVFDFLGTNFAGSQVQPNQVTVQSEFERVLPILTKHDVKTVFAGRTDSGVHCQNQVLHFDTDKDINIKKFTHSVNAILSDDISVKHIQKVDKSFHSQKSATYRWYRYIINNRQTRSILLKDISTHIPHKLNIEEMQKALTYLIGTHDFSSFKKTNTENPAKICNLIYASCRNISEIIYIDLIANRFLYNMVRIAVGTLIKIGQGDIEAEGMRSILQANNRNLAGPTAPPNGLTLMGVGYNEKYNLNNLINMESTTNEQNVLCKTT